jgi:hypothetical protein
MGNYCIVKPTKIALIVIGSLAVMVLVGVYVLTTGYGGRLALSILRPDDPRLIPDSKYVAEAEQMDEVKKFHSIYPNSTGALFRGGPYLVEYSALKHPLPSGSPLPNPVDRATLLVSISESAIVQNVTFGCSYAENNTREAQRFTVSGANVMKYFNDVQEKCWGVPPPQYRDPPGQSALASIQQVD